MHKGTASQTMSQLGAVKNILERQSQQNISGPTQDAIYNSLLKKYHKVLKGRDDHLVAEARQKLYDRAMHLAVLPDGTAFRGDENRREFLEPRPSGRNQPLNPPQPPPNPPHAEALARPHQSGEADAPQPNRNIALAQEDPIESHDPPPLLDDDNPGPESELTKEFIASVLRAMDVVLALEMITVEMLKMDNGVVNVIGSANRSTQIPLDAFIEYMRELQRPNPLASVSFSNDAIAVGRQLMALDPDYYYTRERLQNIMAASGEVDLGDVDAAIDALMVTGITDKIQEAITPEKRVRREKALDERIKQVIAEERNETRHGPGGSE